MVIIRVNWIRLGPLFSCENAFSFSARNAYVNAISEIPKHLETQKIWRFSQYNERKKPLKNNLEVYCYRARLQRIDHIYACCVQRMSKTVEKTDRHT